MKLARALSIITRGSRPVRYYVSMTKRWFAALWAAMLPSALAAQAGPAVSLSPGMVITRSVRVAPGVYRLPGSAIARFRGDHDPRRQHRRRFRRRHAAGHRPDADPDQARGVAILVDGGRNVHIRNARVRGYKVGLLARGTRGLVLVDNDLSYNWKPRLFSVVEHESLVDWLSHHRNDKDEWLRFGARHLPRGRARRRDRAATASSRA